MTTFRAADRDAAVRHLLRHIDDARALRRNPLVAAFFGKQDDRRLDRAALRHIRAIVQRVIDELSSEAANCPREAESLRRQAAIISRCDLAGEPHQRVTADLGLERRQFYRERQRARARIETALRHSVPAAQRQLTALDRYALSLTHARSLRASGQHARAAQILQETWRESTDARRKLESGSLLVEILTESGDVGSSDEVLRVIREIEPPSPEQRALLMWSNALVEETRGNFSEAVAGLRETIAALEALEIERMPAGDELLARSYESLALCRDIDGNNEESASLWSTAHRFVDAHPWLPPAVTARILCHVGMAKLLVLEKPESAESCLLKALAIAESNSLPRETADLACALSYFYLHKGDPNRALESGRWGLELSREAHGRTEYAWRCLNIASVAIGAGKPALAAALARRAIVNDNPQRVQTGLARAIESTALFAAGQRRRAHSAATDAVAVLRSAGSHRLLGSALRTSAEIHFSLESFGDAQSAIEESVDLLSRYGYPNARSKALASCAKICKR
jgi:tetratricopeptide (TPR) repeat protein